MPEKNLVGIQSENLGLGKTTLDLNRQQRLLDFSMKRAIGREKMTRPNNGFPAISNWGRSWYRIFMRRWHQDSKIWRSASGARHPTKIKSRARRHATCNLKPKTLFNL